MTKAEKLKLEEKLERLPAEAQAEVYDFIEFLAHKHQDKKPSGDESKSKQKEIMEEARQVFGIVSSGETDTSVKHDKYFVEAYRE